MSTAAGKLAAVRSILTQHQHPFGPSKAETIAELINTVASNDAPDAQADRIASLEAMAIVHTAELSRAAMVRGAMIDAARGVCRHTEIDAGLLVPSTAGQLVYIDDVIAALTAASAL